MNNNPIGIFDSGIGGLTVTKEIVKQLPDESIIYIGDTARVPYGTRSKEIITRFAKELTNFLLKRNVKCLVVACNTVSSVALEEIKKISPVPVLGVVESTIQLAIKTTKNRKIGVIGTVGTINSKTYDKKIHEINPKIEVDSIPCPLFVPIAEEGLETHQATKLLAEGYLKGLKKRQIDTLILGCTHYPLLSKIIQAVMGRKVSLVDSAKPTAQSLRKILEEKRLLSNKKPRYEFYVTDAPERVLQVASRFFGKILNGKLQQITLPTL
ncbi:MAG: glutamate racemase [Candidatus Daviesbacteria bacterium]|nr:glutamate racemase [Candidatus Daviesbacteria bacterium]